MSIRVAELIVSGLHPGPHRCELCGQEIEARQRIHVEEENEIKAARTIADLFAAGAGAAIGGFIVASWVGSPPEYAGWFVILAYWSVAVFGLALAAPWLAFLGMAVAEALEWRQRKIHREYRHLYQAFDAMEGQAQSPR